VQLVVHVDPPAEHKAYLHRSGRTARAGSSGDVVTVVLPDQRRDTSALMKRAGIVARPQQVTAASEPVVQLVGEIAPYQAPAPRVVTAPPNRAPKRRPNRGGERAKVAARSGQRTRRPRRSA
jgi:superfamily II DNA/RNA helicase